MICGGTLYPLAPLVQAISESVSCSLLPTLNTWDGKAGTVEARERREAKLKTHGYTVTKPIAYVLAKRLPTATSNDGQKGGTEHRTNTTFGNNLPREIAHRLPTTTTRDYKDTPGMAMESGDRNRCDQLPRRVFAESSPALIGGEKMSLEFLCWFMGLPARMVQAAHRCAGNAVVVPQAVYPVLSAIRPLVRP